MRPDGHRLVKQAERGGRDRSGLADDSSRGGGTVHTELDGAAIDGGRAIGQLHQDLMRPGAGGADVGVDERDKRRQGGAGIVSRDTGVVGRAGIIDEDLGAVGVHHEPLKVGAIARPLSGAVFINEADGINAGIGHGNGKGGIGRAAPAIILAENQGEAIARVLAFGNAESVIAIDAHGINPGLCEVEEGQRFQGDAAGKTIGTRNARDGRIRKAIGGGEVADIAAGGPDIKVEDAGIVNVAAVGGAAQVGVIGPMQTHELFLSPIDVVRLPDAGRIR